MRLLCLIAVLAILSPAALAQTVDPEGTRTAVTFHLQGTLVDAEPEPVSPLLARLAEERSLSRLDVDRLLNIQARSVFQAEFSFQSVSEYITWRQSASTVALLEALDGDGAQLSASLSMRRDRSLAVPQDG